MRPAAISEASKPNASRPTTDTLAYNPALDGLRGIAIAAVVVYHLFDGVLRGGFVGVDLFFVLSAFLITTLLLNELDGTGKVSVRSFYERRIRRLAPALLTVLLFVSGYALWFADDLEVGRLRRHLIGALTYSANWVFISDGTTYVDLVAGQSPLRHVWSLAIEEQFYLVVPLAFIAFGRSKSSRSRNRNIVVVSTLLICLSIWQMARVFGSNPDPSRAYFGTDTRIFTMLIGVVLAVVRQALLRARFSDSVRGQARWNRSWNAAAAAAGITFCAVAITATESAAWMFPAGFVAVALASAALVLGAEFSTGARRLLQFPALIFLGQISYGLYLWHWPVRVLLGQRVLHLNGAVLGAAQLAISLVVAVLSYRFLEQPIRRQRWHWKWRVPSPTQFVIGAGLLAVVGAIIVLPSGAATSDSSTAGGSSKGMPAWYSKIGPNTSGGPRAVIVGDSVAHTLAGGKVGSFPNFTPWTPDQMPTANTPFQVFSVAQPGCSLIGPVASRDASGKVLPVELDGLCRGWQDRFVSLLDAARPDLLMVALTNDLNDHQLNGSFITLNSPEGKKVIFNLLDYFRTNAAKQGARVVLLALPKRSGAAPSPNDLDKGGWREDVLRGYYESYAKQHDDVSMVDLRALVCGDTTCDEGTAAFEPSWRYDGLHYTRQGAEAFWNWVLPQLPGG